MDNPDPFKNLRKWFLKNMAGKMLATDKSLRKRTIPAQKRHKRLSGALSE